MKNLPSWFNPDEYSQFLAESTELFEIANIPYQKKRREIALRRRRAARTDAIQTGRERSQEAVELAQAKAKGIMMGLGEQFKTSLTDKFINKLVEEKTPLKADKQKMRPEVDPKDRDRDRKREERKQKKQSGLGDVLVVRNKKLNKIEIITTEDFNPKTHEVIRGRVGKIDKGPVSKADLVRASQKSNFMNTKTSMRLLGKVEKQKEEQETPKQQSSEVEEGDTPESESQPPPPPPMRVPSDGKEITDMSSSYPDWDHSVKDLVFGLAYSLNPNNPPPPELQQLASRSRTFGSAIQRGLKGLIDSAPSLQDMNFQIVPEGAPASKFWSQFSNSAVAGSVATVEGNNGERSIGISIKIGQQIRPGTKGESEGILGMLMLQPSGQKLVNNFQLLQQDYFKELKEAFMTKLPVMYHDDPTHKEGKQKIFKEKLKKIEYQDTKNIFKNRAKKLIEDLLNTDEDIKGSFILECLTGNLKFEGGPGSAQMMISLNKDGTNAKLIPIDKMLASTLANSEQTYLSPKFTDGDGSMFDQMYDQSIGPSGSPINFVSELEKIQEIKDPVSFIRFFNISLNDVVYFSPIDYSEYYENDTDGDTSVIVNPGTSAEKEIRIPIKKTYDTDGKEENVIEKGIDHMLEEYDMINDYLVDLVNNGNLPKEEAVKYIQEEFNLFFEERDYRAEYDNYHSKPKQRANRSKRVLARRKLERQGRVRKGDGKDVDHKNGNPQDNSDDNLRVLSKSKNRSMNEDHGAGFEGTPELLRKLIKDTPYAQSTPVLAKSKKYKESK